MSERRRGLGRGLGALIPSAPTGERPVDVFFGEPRATTPAAGGDPAGDRDGAGDGDARGADARPAPEDRAGPPAEPAPAPAGWHIGVPDQGGSAGEAGGSTGNGAGPALDPPADRSAGPADGHGGDSPAGPATRTGDRQSSHDWPTGGTPTGPALVPVPGATFREVPLDRVRPNPRQPRTSFDADALAELVHSVREVGVLQPVVVREAGADESGPRYELVMGERRWRACQEAGLASIPAIVRETGQDDLLRDALLENLHRSDLNPLEEAAAYQQLLDDFGCTHDELAQRIGRSRPQISNTLRLLRLPALVQRRVAAGVLSAGHARALLGLEDPAAMERLAQRVVAEGLSVRATEEAVAVGATGEDVPVRRRPRPGERHAALDDLATRLSDRFDTRVRIALGRRKGTLTVDFASVEDLDRILAAMVPDEGRLLGREAPPA